MRNADSVVVKLGGDALASPERIVAEARRLARLASVGAVVAVTSARRGVTDHLLGLVEAVRRAAEPRLSSFDDSAEADRAVATGEVVTAALLALALNDLGVEAVSLDAREAGVLAAGRFGGARIRAISTRRLQSLIARRVVPVVTGFQGWHRGRVATLGRGGTDTSAVALAGALGAGRVALVKDAEGLRTADPRLVPDSRAIVRAPHRFLSALTAAGARVLQAEAAVLAERQRITLEFYSLESEVPLSVVSAGESGSGIRAVTSAPAGDEATAVTVVTADSPELAGLAESVRSALLQAGVTGVEAQPAAGGLRFLVPDALATTALRVAHAVAVEDGLRLRAPALWAS